VLRGTGEFYWDRGELPDAGGGVPVDAQAYKANGWTIAPEGLRTRISYDRTKHGMFINAVEVRGF
jgi:Ca-activated chloride channel family protein